MSRRHKQHRLWLWSDPEQTRGEEWGGVVLAALLREWTEPFPNRYPGGARGYGPLDGWLPSTTGHNLADGEDAKVASSFS